MEFNTCESIPKKAKTEKFFYSQVPYDVWTRKTLPDSAVRLYAAYHSFCKNKKIESGQSMTFVSLSKLAGLLDWSVSKVQRQQELLEKEGFITVKKRGQMKSNMIYLNKSWPKERPNDALNNPNDDSSKEANDAYKPLSSEDVNDLLNK